MWQRAATTNEGTGENTLNGISARTQRDIWAVGHAQNQSLTLHYDGSSWSVVPSPNLEFGVKLEDVVTLAANDAWAVGWSGSSGSLDDVNVAMHWDGTNWTIVPTPQPGGTEIDRLLAVDARAPNDVWAVGLYSPNPVAEDHSLILHWDGTSWSVVQHDCDTYGGLTGVTLLSATEGWAVGDSETCHYNGSSWTEVPSPQPRIEYSEIGYPLEDVSGVKPRRRLGGRRTRDRHGVHRRLGRDHRALGRHAVEHRLQPAGPGPVRRGGARREQRLGRRRPTPSAR